MKMSIESVKLVDMVLETRHVDNTAFKSQPVRPSAPGQDNRGPWDSSLILFCSSLLWGTSIIWVRRLFISVSVNSCFSSSSMSLKVVVVYRFSSCPSKSKSNRTLKFA